MSFFVRPPELSTRQWKSKLHLVSDKNSWNGVKVERSMKLSSDGTIQWVKYHFLLVVCSNRVSILYRFW